MMKRFVSNPKNPRRIGCSIFYLAGTAVLLGAPFAVFVISLFISAPVTAWLYEFSDRARPHGRRRH